MIANCRLFLLCLLLLLLCDFASAQYRFDSWTTDNGLPQNGVRSIAQTPDGYLWFTTLDGLVRFDGLKFTVFDKNNSKGIINNRFWGIFAAPNGDIWAGTPDGELTIYSNGVFTSYPAEQIPETQITGFELDTNGEILINTGANLYNLRNGKFTFAKTNAFEEVTKSTFFGKNNVLWKISLSETQQIKDGQTQSYPLSLQYLNAFGANIIEDSKGGLWIAEVGKLHYLYEGKITTYNEKDGIPQKTLAHDFWEETDGSMWFATGDFSTAGVGLVRFKDGKFSRFGMESGLSNDRIFRVFKDREGTVWLTTNKGLNRLRRQIITTLSKPEGLLQNEVYPILKANDGSVYVGGVGGLSHYKYGKFTQITLPVSPDSVISIQSLWEDADGRIWVGAVGGIFVIENGKLKNMNYIFRSQETVSVIYSDKKGNIWFGTEKDGVFQYRDDKIVANYTTEQGLPSNEVKVIHEAIDGSLWFGNYGGLSHFKEGKFTNYTTKDGLGSNFVRSIAEDPDGTLWIGTYDGGLMRFKDGKIFNFNTENGLFNNGVFATVEDDRGNFWISSNKGIYRVSKKQLNDFAAGKIDKYQSFSYGKQDGMLNTECNGGRQPSAIKDNDGKIWFPTLEGVSIVDPKGFSYNSLPPPVKIENVEIDRKKVEFSEIVNLSQTQSYLDITYTALSFIKSDQISFKYKLEGLDKDWIEAGTRRTVNYSYLPPGEYVFRVIAANTDGVWNNEGDSIKIFIEAPFYKTWRFWLAFSIILAGIGYLVYRYRINQLRKINAAQETFSRQLIESQEAERKRIAQELHDGLGQNLLVIKNRALLGLAVAEKDEQLNEIQDSVTDALSEVRTIAYNLRPLHIERLGLTSTIEEMIEEVEESSGIEINYEIAKIDDVFSEENEINFYRIVQECLNNIVKHSNAKQASVSVYRENDKLILIVKDNGKGFEIDVAKENQGLGLNGIAERVKILGGNYLIVSEIDKGTTFSAEFVRKN